MKISLLPLALLAVTGCTTLNSSWFSSPIPEGILKPAGSESTQNRAASPSATHDAPKTPPSAGQAKLDNRAMADYLRDLAKGAELEQSRRYPDAEKHYQQLIKQCPTRYEAYHHLGQICDRQKHYSEAQDNYQQAILLAGEREPALFNDLGYSFFLQGKLDKAESAIRKAVALRPTEPMYHNNLGLVYGHQNRSEEAWNEFRKAGGDADACFNLAFVKSSLNDFEGAKACFRRALAIDPTHDGARRALRAFELAETDPDSLAQLETSSGDGIRWVPYVENGQGQEPSAAATTTPAPSPNRSMSSRNARLSATAK